VEDVIGDVTKYFEKLADVTRTVWEEADQKAVQEWTDHATGLPLTPASAAMWPPTTCSGQTNLDCNVAAWE
jgi:hypothetical protein